MAKNAPGVMQFFLEGFQPVRWQQKYTFQFLNVHISRSNCKQLFNNLMKEISKQAKDEVRLICKKRKILKIVYLKPRTKTIPLC
jgi:hypothetical protein